MAAICGKRCALTLGSQTYTAHAFTISYAGREIDVSSFGSSIYGDHVVCLIDAVLTAQCYDRPTLVPGDVITAVATFAETPSVILTFALSKVISVTDEVDAKGIVNHTVTVRLTALPTQTS